MYNRSADCVAADHIRGHNGRPPNSHVMLSKVSVDFGLGFPYFIGNDQTTVVHIFGLGLSHCS